MMQADAVHLVETQGHVRPLYQRSSKASSRQIIQGNQSVKVSVLTILLLLSYFVLHRVYKYDVILVEK